jgi:crotonobetainyl-CoA:carnitine CoA-transferase CaiB-like acyl-CoA transferase
MQGLADVRVIDFSTGYCGAYCTKLLADGGADVIKVEAPGGDALRHWSATGADLGGTDSAIFRYLHTSKRSIVGSLADPAVQGLVADADLVVEDFGASGAFDRSSLRAGRPQLVVLSISPFGLTGPLADRPATEFTVQAESGSILYRGRPDQPPIQGGGRISDWTAACYAAPAALGAVWRARRTGVGDDLDFSIAEVSAIAASTFSDLSHHMAGRPPLTTVCRNLETPSIEPARDGWIGFNTNAAHMFQGLLLMIERADLFDDADLASFGGRTKRRAEWEGILHAWTTQHDCDEIMTLAAELRVPCTQVYDGKTIFKNEHLRERGVFVDNPDGFKQPRPPYLIDGVSPRKFTPAPKLGEHTGAIEARPRPLHKGQAVLPNSAEIKLPFEGMRILDITSWWAGPSSTHFFALLGAEVWHVESITHLDGMRMTGYMFGRPDWWEWGHMFTAANTNKLGITIDIDQPAGKQLIDDLIRECDVVAENFVPRVIEKWGLDWDHIHQLNKRAIYLRMPAFGLSGPWRQRPGFAQTMEQMTGMAWITGHLDDQPRIMRGPCDPIAGLHGATALMVALWEREHSGEGAFIESTMVEAALNCSAEQIIEYTAYGNVMMRSGNRSPYAAPQGVYACPGFEQWLAISVVTDEQWDGLRRALGNPAWADDAALSTLTGRHERHDAIDDALDAWAASHELDDAVALLLAHGVPAARCWDPRIQSRHPQMVARGFYEDLVHPSIGVHPVPTLPFKYSGVDRWTNRAAPTLGQDTRAVLTRVLGKTEAECDQLEVDGVIGTRPKGV